MSYYGSKIWNLLYAGIMLKKIQMYLGNEQHNMSIMKKKFLT